MSDKIELDLDAIQAAAKAATGGVWVDASTALGGIVRAGPVQEWVNGSGQDQIIMATGAQWMEPDEPRSNAAFCAAACPAVVLELIRRLRTAEAAIKVTPADWLILRADNPMQAEEVSKGLGKLGIRGVVMPRDFDIEALDEEQMRQAGWVRAEQRDDLVKVLEGLFEVGSVYPGAIEAKNPFDVDFEVWEEKALAALARAKGGAA